MNHLKEHYRELSENRNFLNESRFVYQGAPVPEARPAEPPAPEKAEKPKKSEPFPAKKFEDYQAHFEKHMDALKKADINKYNEFKKTFVDRLNGLKREYQDILKKWGGDRTEHQERAATYVKPQVNSLLSEIRGHLSPETKARLEGTGAEEPAEAKPAAAPEADRQRQGAEKAEKPPITVDSFLSLEKGDREIIDNAVANLILTNYKGFIESFGLSQEKTKILADLEKFIQGYIKELKNIEPLLKKGNYDEYFKEQEGIWNKYKSSVETFTNTVGEVKDARKIIEAAYQHALGSKDYKKEDKTKLTTAMGNLEGKAKASAERGEAEKGPEAGKILEGPKLQKAVDLITNQLYNLDPKIKMALSKEDLAKTIAKFKFSPDQIKQIEEGKKVDLNGEQMRAIQNAMAEKINEYDPRKGDMIHRLLTNYKMNKEKLGAPIAHAINDMFDTDGKPMRKFLVMKWPITEANGQLRIDNNPIDDLSKLTQYLPPDAQDHFKSILDLKGKPEAEQLSALKGEAKDKPGRTPGLEEKLWASGETNVKALEGMKKLQREMLGAERGGTSPMEGLTLLLQLFAAIKKAFSDHDWASLNDFLSDWNKSKNPKELAKKVEESKKSYGEMLEKNKPTDIDQLLKTYLKPRGDEADKLFGKTGPTSKYRGEAPPAIQNYLVGKLGLGKIASITELTNGRTQIEGYKTDGTHIAIEFFKDAGTQKAEFKLYETVKEGEKMVEKKRETGRVIPDITLANLKTEIGNTGKLVATPAPAPTPTKQEGVKVALKGKARRKGK